MLKICLENKKMERKGDIYVLMVGGREEKRLKKNLLKTRFLFVGFERLRSSQEGSGQESIQCEQIILNKSVWMRSSLPVSSISSI